MSFTTPAFQQEARRLVLEEANRVAGELRLPEPLPITEGDIVRSFVGPFGYTYTKEQVGNITTRNYRYGVEAGYKLSEVGIANWENRCRKYRDECQWPASKLDTNSALRLAAEWLEAFKVDLHALSQDCDVHIEVSEYWNGLSRGETLRKQTFVPIYDAWWSLRSAPSQRPMPVASVELFVPTNTLLTLQVIDAKYLLRPPVVFTNLAALFPGTAVITTNHAMEPIVIHGNRDGTRH
jgi:hypothetical protein